MSGRAAVDAPLRQWLRMPSLSRLRVTQRVCHTNQRPQLSRSVSQFPSLVELQLCISSCFLSPFQASVRRTRNCDRFKRLFRWISSMSDDSPLIKNGVLNICVSGAHHPEGSARRLARPPPHSYRTSQLLTELRNIGRAPHLALRRAPQLQPSLQSNTSDLPYGRP